MKYFKQLIFLFVLLFWGGNIYAQNVSIEVNISHSPVYLGEEFQIIYTIHNASRGIEFLNPNFGNFTVLSGPNRKESAEIVLDNNGIRKDVLVSYSFVLRPKSIGVFQVKGGGININGQHISAPNFKINVVKNDNQSKNRMNDFDDDIDDDIDAFFKRQQQMARQMLKQMRDLQGEEAPKQNIKPNASELTIDHINENIFLKAEVDQLNPLVGQQVNVIYKLYTRLGMSMQPSAVPQLDGFWAKDEEVNDMGKAHQENYHGRLYNVFTLKKTALFPQKSGQLIIDPFKAYGWVIVLEPNGYSYSEKRVDMEVVSQAVQLNVKPLPKMPDSYTGGVGKMNINARLPQVNYTTDDLIQFKLQIIGSGNLELISAPKIIFPKGLNSVPPEIRDSISELMPKMEGSRTFVYNLSADSAGKYIIPGVEWSYYDTDEKIFKTFKTQNLLISISDGKREKSNIVSEKSNKEKFNEIYTDMPLFKDGSNTLFSKWYFWAVSFLPIILLLGFSYRRKIKENRSLNPLYKDAAKIAKERLAAALKAMNHQQSAVFYKEISKAIWLYLSDQLNIPLSNLNKNNLSLELENRNISPDLIQITIEQIEHCELALYSLNQERTNQKQLYNEISRLIQQYEKLF
ncbi:MAG TPA: BatD family protein [Edaphocola sp.]|nr:BatD family protein [Edaphocola sp.]